MGQLIGGIVAPLLLRCRALTQHLTATHTPQRSFVKGRLHNYHFKVKLHLSPNYPAVSQCWLGAVEYVRYISWPMLYKAPKLGFNFNRFSSFAYR